VKHVQCSIHFVLSHQGFYEPPTRVPAGDPAWVEFANTFPVFLSPISITEGHKGTLSVIDTAAPYTHLRQWIVARHPNAVQKSPTNNMADERRARDKTQTHDRVSSSLRARRGGLFGLLSATFFGTISTGSVYNANAEKKHRAQQS